MRSAISALMLALASNACASSPARIGDGLYADAPESGVIAVRGNEMEFRMNVTDARVTRPGVRSYKYSLERDGRIRFQGSSNDSFMVFELLKYEWTWTGIAIERKGHDSGVTTTFKPLEAQRAQADGSKDAGRP